MAFGIDFGTTNSAVTFDGKVLVHTGGWLPFPSLIAVNRATGEVKCGAEAKAHRELLAGHNFEVIGSVKRELGGDRQWSIAGRTWRPEEIATEVFKGLRALVEGRRDLTKGTSLDEAVISVPVGFTAERRRVLRKAAGSAGVAVKGFVSEPTAAFIHCRASQALANPELVAVFDWGGGTLDVSIIRVRGTQVEELATEGLPKAGDAIDEALAIYMHRQAYPDGLPWDEVRGEDRDDLITASERAKIELNPERTKSRPNEVNISLLRGHYRGKTLPPMNLGTVDRIVTPFIDESLAVLDRALAKARMTDMDLDNVLVVGGSSRLRLLQDRLEFRFNQKVFTPPHEAWAVSQGASEVALRPGCYQLMHPVYLVLSDGSLMHLAEKGDEADKTIRSFAVGLTELSEVAQLVFAEPEGRNADGTSPLLRHIGYLSMAVHGFPERRIELKSQLTRDLTLRVLGKMAGEGYHEPATWEYGQLRFAYDMRR